MYKIHKFTFNSLQSFKFECNLLCELYYIIYCVHFYYSDVGNKTIIGTNCGWYWWAQTFTQIFLHVRPIFK